MNFTISIDDETLQKSLEQGVLNIEPKRLAEMAEEAVFQYLQRDSVIESILFERKRYGYGADYNEPRGWFVKVIKECFSTADVVPYKNKFLETVDHHGEAIVIKTMAEVFSKMLMTPEMQNNLSIAFSNAMRG